MEINIWGGENISACKIKPVGRGIKLENKDTESEQGLIKERTRNISKGEAEIKTLLNSGFIAKNDENFLLNSYGFIDKEVRNNFNAMFLKNNFVEIQGASFNAMTAYGRNITVKDIIMSSKKFNEINSAKHTGNYAKYDEKFNAEYKLSEFTLKNYFELKRIIPGIDARNAVPGVIEIGKTSGSNSLNDLKQIKYAISEIPSSYKFKFEKDRPDIFSAKNPELGMLKDFMDTKDGFRNAKVTVNGKKILEIESIHNWQKIMNYVKNRDMQFLGGMKKNEKGEISGRIEIHHIKQLQDGGMENVKNLIAIGEDTHRLADSHRILIDKNTGYYREYNSGDVGSPDVYKTGKEPSFLEKNYNALLAKIGILDLNDKIMLNDIKLDVESNSAMRLSMLADYAEDMRLLFIDEKTGEEFRLFAAKTDDETDKNIAKTALINFVKELATGI
jgi:hypothetical protein